MKNYVFFCTSGENWFKISSKIFSKGIAKPTLWIGDDVFYKEAKEIYGESNVKSFMEMVYYSYLLNEINYKGNYYEFFESENYLRAKDRCLKMMDRLDKIGCLSRKDREIYFNNIVLFGLDHFAKYPPDFLLTVVAPHSHAQYAIYEICLFLNIPILKFNQWGVAPCIYLTRMDTGKMVEKESINKEFKNIIEKSIEDNCMKIISNKASKYMPLYMSRQRNNSKLSKRIISLFQITIPSLMKGLFYDLRNMIIRLSFIIFGDRYEKRYKFLGCMTKNNLYNQKDYFNWNLNSIYDPINPFGFNFFIREILLFKRRIKLLKSIKSLPEYSKPKCKFVFFPLAYEHERSSNPDAGIFHEQIIAISWLRKFLPDEIKIIIKEHPTQYFYSLRGPYSSRGPNGRSPIFKNLLKNIHNTEFIGINTNSMQILDDCLFVATLTGTVAYEAALLGKKAIIFGETWYTDMPNIYNWNDKIDYSEFIKYRIKSPREVIDFLKQKAINTCAIGTQIGRSEVLFKNTIENIPSYKEVSRKSIEDLIIYAISNF